MPGHLVTCFAHVTTSLFISVVTCIKAPSFVDSVDDPWSPSDLYTTTTTSAVYAIFGKEVYLDCPLPRSRPASVTWVDFVYNSDRDPASIFGEDRRLNEDHPNRENYQVDSDFRLTISHLAFEDAGEYRCLSRTTEGLQHSISYYLAIIVQPHCFGTVSVMESQSTVLTCFSNYSGNYKPSVEWQRNGEMVEEGVEDLFDIRLAMLALHVRPTHEDDGAQFSCLVQMGSIVEECSLTLNVSFWVRDVNITPVQEKYRVGDTIRCSAKGNPVPEVTIRPAAVLEKSGPGWKSIVLSEELVGKVHDLNCTARNSIDGQYSSISESLSFAVVEAEVEQEKSPADYADVPLDRGPGKSSAAVIGTSGAIVAGIIVGAVILAIIVVAVVCVRIRKEKKAPKVENGAKKMSVAEKDANSKKDAGSQV